MLLPNLDSFTYEQLPQRIVFGWGRLKELPAEIDRLAAGRVLLISERSTAPIADTIRDNLGDALVGITASVRPHVPIEDVNELKEEAASLQAEIIVTVGGGSATGLGKAIAARSGIPLVSIPTTYAGSEVTPIYGVTEEGRKRTGRDERVLPRTVVYDPSLTTSLPRRATASTGMNAIAHCVEALYAENATPMTDLLAQEAIRMLVRSLPVCVLEPRDRAARSLALYGAYLAGTVLAATGMAVHHRICHVLGGTFGLAHGDANAAVLPHAVAFNEPAAPAPLTLVAEAFGAVASAPALFDLAASLGAPSSLEELGLEREDLARAASLVVERDFYNPRPAEFDDVLNILTRAFEGHRPDGPDQREDP